MFSHCFRPWKRWPEEQKRKHEEKVGCFKTGFRHAHYCWWKKSCTSWYGKYPIIYMVSYMLGGAGFLPSTVCRIVPSGCIFFWMKPSISQKIPSAKTFPKNTESLKQKNKAVLDLWKRWRKLMMSNLQKQKRNWSRSERGKCLGGGFKYFLFSTRNLGKWSNLTNIFQMGWNHQLDVDCWWWSLVLCWHWTAFGRFIISLCWKA